MEKSSLLISEWINTNILFYVGKPQSTWEEPKILSASSLIYFSHGGTTCPCRGESGGHRARESRKTTGSVMKQFSSPPHSNWDFHPQEWKLASVRLYYLKKKKSYIQVLGLGREGKQVNFLLKYNIHTQKADKLYVYRGMNFYVLDLDL